MKSNHYALLLLAAIFYHSSYAGSWVVKTNIPGTERTYSAGFTINGILYYGTGTSASSALVDFWEYAPITGTWTQKADFGFGVGGTSRVGAVAFGIGNFGYMGLGREAAGTYPTDFYKYDPGSNTWSSIAAFIGAGRRYSVGFGIASTGKGYVGTGQGAATYDDFYEYDPAGNSWLAKANFPGAARRAAVGFSINGKGYLGTGRGAAIYDDFYEYEPGGNNWIAKASVPGGVRWFASGFSTDSVGLLGGGLNGSIYTDWYRYTPGTNAWTVETSFTGAARSGSTGLISNTSGFLFGGFTSTQIKELYEYTDVPIPLPVEFLFFTAVITSDNKVLCQWATASETNNDYFVLERTNDGLNYQPLQQVSGSGNTANTKYYSAIDAEPFSGTSYYRLKQVDFNGSYSYSEVVSINLNGIDLISIYPNPATDNFGYLVGSAEECIIKVEVLDAAGRKIISSEETIGAGISLKKINASAFASGNYILSISNGALEIRQKQFLIK